MQQRNPQKSPLAGDLQNDDGLGAVMRMRYQAQKLGQGITTQPIGFAGAPGQATPDPRRDANGKIVLGNSAVNRQYTPPPTMTTTAPPAPTNTNTDPRQAAIDAAKQKSQDKLAAAGGVYDPTGTMDPEMKELASSRYALQQQQQVDKAKAQQQAAAAAGIGGLGLSGGSVAQQGDIGRAQDRSAQLGLEQFDQNASNQKWADIQRQAALDELEADNNLDLNGDGKIGGQAAGGKIGDGVPDDFGSGSRTTEKTTDGQTQAAPINAPITDAERQMLPNGEYHLDKIKDGAFSAGSKYFGSDDSYDYYTTSDGSFYRVHR